MENFRKYGKAPFKMAVIHGGPGAPGEMAAVARELGDFMGTLEPLQTAKSIKGQVAELKFTLEKHAILPAILIGFSWGAWLSYIFTACYPSLVTKLIMVGSPPFEDSYANSIMETRLSRLDKEEREEVKCLFEMLNDPSSTDKNRILERFGRLMFKADSYKPLIYSNDIPECQYDVYRSVWKEAAELRKNGALLEYGRKIRCPVIAIHGNYDPHPAEGVYKPLSAIIKDCRFIELEKCGHYPWLEKQARDAFYRILKKELDII